MKILSAGKFLRLLSRRFPSFSLFSFVLYVSFTFIFVLFATILSPDFFHSLSSSLVIFLVIVVISVNLVKIKFAVQISLNCRHCFLYCFLSVGICLCVGYVLDTIFSLRFYSRFFIIVYWLIDSFIHSFFLSFFLFFLSLICSLIR